jgi:hypothetical protein
MKTNLLICAAVALVNFSAVAAPLTASTFTEIIRDVNTLSAAGNPAAAKVNDVLQAPDRVRTGPESRAELTAADNTITRVGANTVFSFSDSGRTLNLEQGSLLFHSPKGKGGGTIKSGGVSAAVLGTTLIVSATTDGGFKVILLEGLGTVTLANGKSVELTAGQMVFVVPGGKKFSSVVHIHLGKLVAGSNLVNGFGHPLASWPLIEAAIERQKVLLARSGEGRAGKPTGHGLATVDHAGYQTAARPPVDKQQFAVLSSAAIGAGTGGRNFTTLNFIP